MRRLIPLLFVALPACAHHIPLPEQYRVPNAAALVAKMQSAQVHARVFSAEARLSYFGNAGRFKGTASLLVARPDKLRYELQGPHGGVINAVACDGVTLSVLDMRQNQFERVPATPDNLDRLLQWVPLGLGAPDWVALLFGEVAVPPDAALTYDDSDGTYVLTWHPHAVTLGASIPAEVPRDIAVAVAPDTGRLMGGTVREAGKIVSTFRIASHTSDGLPEVLRLGVPAANADLEVRLRDIALDPVIDPAVFVLQSP